MCCNFFLLIDAVHRSPRLQVAPAATPRGAPTPPTRLAHAAGVLGALARLDLLEGRERFVRCRSDP